MKIRIQDNAVRYRITLKELDTLNSDGAIEAHTAFPDGIVFRYAVRKTSDHESICRCEAQAIVLYLSPADVEALSNAQQEGVYLRTERGGERFMAFIEKDRPASRCDKPEEWIYDTAPGAKPVTFPIAK
jgi:hypothetical protein